MRLSSPAVNRWSRSSARRLVAISLGVATMMGVTVGPVSAAAADETYTVAQNETLSHVAVRTGTSVSALVAANNIKNPDHVWAGTVLVIPAGASAQAPARTTTYVVVWGDTLSEIAARAGISTSQLMSMNSLDDRHAIREGQKLTVPASSAVGGGGAASYPNLLDKVADDPRRTALIPYFEKWAAANDISADLLMSLAWQESGWNNAVISHKGAVGIGQLMPNTASWIAHDLIGYPELDSDVPEHNIRMSARFLDWLLDTMGDENLAIAAYYQGPGSVRSGELYRSTELYVASVQAHRQFFVRE